MLGVLSQQLFLQSLDSFAVALAVQVGSLLHSGEGSPALRVNDVGVLEGVGHVVGYAEGTAGLLGVMSCNLLNLRHDLVAFRMSQDNLHTHSGHQADNALGNGEGFAVGGRVSPGHSQLFALQVLHAAELVDDVQHIGHTLGGMVDVAL